MLTYLINGNLEEVSEVTDSVRETEEFLSPDGISRNVESFVFYPVASSDSFNLEVVVEDSEVSPEVISEFTEKYDSIILTAFDPEEFALVAAAKGSVEVF